MRRRWPVLAATIPLVFGWTLAVAHPAAAHTGVAGPGGLVQPGGPVSQLGLPGGGTQPGAWASPTGTAPQPGAWASPTGTAPQAAAGGQSAVVSSSNWAGYAATGGTGAFTSVASSWVQPAGRCSSGQQYAAFWVGLDGYSSGTVEQTGTEVDCAGGTASYYAWYEVYPGTAVTFPNPVNAGDHFSGAVSYLGSNQFRLTLTDSTAGWTQTINATLPGAARSSAEVIAEAVCCTSSGGDLPLTNFGTMGFSGATVNNAGLCKPNPVEITMPETLVSAVTNCGDFTVTYTGSSSGFAWLFGDPGPF